MTDVRVESADFQRLFSKSSQVDKKLKTALRRNIRIAGELAADKVRVEVAGGGGSKTGLRLGIAAGVKVKVMSGARAGVTISAGSSQMPAGKESLVRAWESKKGWRHPVFNSDRWVQQTGSPYFRETISGQRNSVRLAVEAAMTEAAASLKG